ELLELTKETNLTDETAFKIADRLHRIVGITAMQSIRLEEDDLGMKRIMSSYVYKKLSLDEFAKEINMSKSNAIRLYKKKYGITPYEDLINMKIEAAKTFLSETGLPIKEIAEKLCIYDEHYFSTLFMKRTGKRPGEYRKENSM
ncbi:MAG: helix-turn-helix transcriptional regulator, partial [Clostridia bacterium]|nr:helix-turn-helix transcriptional regulator [Clostridia bacterium]